MAHYILRRLLAVIPVLLGLTVIVFAIMAMIPGDPATAILGSYATPENVDRINRALGLDKPLVQQYFIWLGNILHGDFGRSYTQNRPVIDIITERFGNTLILAGTSLVLCSILGLLAGIVSAVRQYGFTDKLVTLFVLIGISVPSFWLGLLLILVFAVKLQWLPASGMYAIYGGGGPMDLIRHLILPAFTLSVVATGVVARLTRTSMLEVLRQDYIRTARAKGLSEAKVVYRHGLRATLTPLITQLGADIALLLGGVIVIEQIYGLQGVGALAVQSVRNLDRPVIIGVVLMGGCFIVITNIIVDLLYAVLDPRVRGA